MKVPMPPDHGLDKKINRYTLCVPLDGDNTVEVVVKSDGEFFYFPPGYFSPELPFGFRKEGDPQPNCVALEAGDVFMVYLDNHTGKVYVTDFKIQPQCP